jgi:hypothetical protein
MAANGVVLVRTPLFAVFVRDTVGVIAYNGGDQLGVGVANGPMSEEENLAVDGELSPTLLETPARLFAALKMDSQRAQEISLTERQLRAGVRKCAQPVLARVCMHEAVLGVLSVDRTLVRATPHIECAFCLSKFIGCGAHCDDLGDLVATRCLWLHPLRTVDTQCFPETARPSG